MMLRALSKVRYPSGRSGKEYNVGETFEALSERDANILIAVKLAELAPSRASRKTLGLKAAGSTSDAGAEPAQAVAGTYNRRDMRAED
jgi:hypothetical protein